MKIPVSWTNGTNGTGSTNFPTFSSVSQLTTVNGSNNPFVFVEQLGFLLYDSATADNLNSFPCVGGSYRVVSNSVKFLPSQLNNGNFVIAAGALVPTVAGDNTISWTFLYPNTSHNTYFFTSATPNNSTGQLHITFPTVSRVVTFLAVTDDVLAKKGVFIGASIGVSEAVLNVYQTGPVCGYISGNGTSYTVDLPAVQGASGSNISFSYDNTTGIHTLSNIPGWVPKDAYGTVVSYGGANNHRPVFLFSGLSNYQMKWKLIDGSGTTITGAPTTEHKMFISCPPFTHQIHTAVNSTGSPRPANVFTSGSAIIILGVFELPNAPL